MRASDLLGAAVAAAMALALTALTPITADSGLFLDCLVLIAAIGGAGILARRLIRGDGMASAVQATIGAATWFALALGAGLTSPFALPRVLADGVQWTVISSAPMGPNLGVRLVTGAAVGVLAFLADQLAVAHGQASWTLLPLGVPYLLSALALPTTTSLGTLLALAAGYLLVLLADSATRRPRFAVAARGTLDLLTGGLVCLLAAAPVAALAGVVTPGIDPDRPPPFTGRGPVQMGDPSLDLRRNLQQPVDRRILTYTTSSRAGARLRLTSLPVFDAGGFHLSPIELFDGPLPAPPGAPLGRPRFQIDVAVEGFNSEWLPLPYAPADFRAGGDWRHDPVSLSVLATSQQRGSATNGLRYQATIVDVEPSAEQVAAARAGTPSDAGSTAVLPADLPPRVRALAQEITRRGTTDGRKAVLIQNWLRSAAFTYSTDPAPGSGYDALTRFLFDDRTGYCEQFAASMAVLARAVGIPSRVAVGFLPGSRAGDGWEVSIRDMHAWPELYLESLGWVAFEPTPSVASPPDYAGGGPSAAPTRSATPEPSPTVDEPTPQTEEPAPAPEPEQPAAEQPGPDWPVWAGGGALAAVVAATPWGLRRLRRARRLSASGPRQAVAGAWDEIRDSVWDAGGRWPHGSARQIGDLVSAGLPSDAAAALGRVAVLVEQARYAQTLGAVDGLRPDVQVVRAGLVAILTGPQKWMQVVLPRSLWRRLWWRG